MKKVLLTLFLILLLPLSALATDYSADANCKGYWPMEDGISTGAEDETDENAGTDLVVSASDTIPNNADCMFGSYSRDFERGDIDEMSHGDGNETDIYGADQKMSVVAWYKREADSGGYEVIVSKQYMLETFNTDKGSFRVYGNGGWKIAQGASSVPTGSWTHLAGVYNDVDVRLYFNGSLDSNGASNPTTWSGGIDNKTWVFEISYLYATYAADGLIDDVAIFDRDLSSVETSDIYTNGVAPAAPPSYYQVITTVIN